MQKKDMIERNSYLQSLHIAKLVLGLLFITALSGCSREPHSTELFSAVEKQIKESHISNMFGGALKPLSEAMGIEQIVVDSVEKINCLKSMDNDYVCEVMVKYSLKVKEGSLAKLSGMSGQNKLFKKYRLIKLESGWVAEDINNQR